MFYRLENNSSNIKLLPNRRLQNKFNMKSQNISDFSNIFFFKQISCTRRFENMNVKFNILHNVFYFAPQH